jgi:YegS/Rv2252/BmrU family lipid kinase
VKSPFGPLTLIVNPRSGRGRVEQEMPEIERTLLANGLEFRVMTTQAAGDATRFARTALERGDQFLVAVGGDGTVHEVVNGMFDGRTAINPEAVLGIVAAGSGCDFVKTFGLPADVTRAVRHLTGDSVFPIDIGVVTYADHDGGRVTRLFPNIAEAGLGGDSVARAERLPRRLGRSRYFWGFWLAMRKFKAVEVRVDADGRAWSGRANNVVVANGQYFGGGMKISPRSMPADGQLDVQVSTGPKSDAFTTLPKIYRGEHIPSPNIKEFLASKITVDADRPLRIEADGEVLGTTPATFEVLHEVLRLKI